MTEQRGKVLFAALCVAVFIGMFGLIALLVRGVTEQETEVPSADREVIDGTDAGAATARPGDSVSESPTDPFAEWDEHDHADHEDEEDLLGPEVYSRAYPAPPTMPSTGEGGTVPEFLHDLQDTDGLEEAATAFGEAFAQPGDGHQEWLDTVGPMMTDRLREMYSDEVVWENIPIDTLEEIQVLAVYTGYAEVSLEYEEGLADCTLGLVVENDEWVVNQVG